ncbi:MAG TPA: c-type cytochrome [Polyangiaceae bacterium]|nr:c-type cytochrome [Polyangiaceae bacterium]
MRFVRCPSVRLGVISSGTATKGKKTRMFSPSNLPISLRLSFAFAVLAFAACSGGGEGENELGAGSAPQVEDGNAGAGGAPAEPAPSSGGAPGSADPGEATGNKPPVGEPVEPGAEEPGPKGGTGPGTGQEGTAGEDSAPEPMPEAPSEEFLRGEALVEKSGCVTCHQKNFAGFTVFPNITPDETTGIGEWTDAQIAAAIRDGIDVDGSKLCATMMRYPFTDAEVGDIVAFLRGIPAVSNEVTSDCPGHAQ